MFQYRQVLVRLRQGDTDREIARSRLMGRRKVAAFRVLCERHGWLSATAALPEDATLAAALCREHGYTGSYSSVHRLIAALEADRPPEATVPLNFAPAEAAQVDFGAGPVLTDPAVGRERRT